MTAPDEARMTLADVTAGAADREREPARPDDFDRLRARRDAEVLRAAADEIDSGHSFPLPPSVFSALLRERADRIAGDQS